MKELISKRAPEAIGPYSQGIEINGLFYFSGAIAINRESGQMITQSLEAEINQVFLNLSYLLQDQGLSFEHVFKTTIFLTDMAYFAQVNEVYGKHFKKPYPARSTVAVKDLPKGARLEIEMIAKKA